MRPPQGALRAVSCIALACALCVPAIAGQTDYLLKLGGVEGEAQAGRHDDRHKDQIEILSYSWGETRHVDGNGRADALTDGLLIIRNHDEQPQPIKTGKVDSISVKQSTHASGGGHGAGKVSVHDISTTHATGAAGAPRANDRLRTAGPRDGWPGAASASGGVSVAAGDVNGDGRAERTGAPSYLNRTRQKELLTPASTGSVALNVSPGHGLCTAGKGLGTLTLQGAGGRAYRLGNVTVVGCEAVAGGDRPSETLTLNYEKIDY